MAIFAAILVELFIVILGPFLYFATGWFIGWLIKIMFGNMFVSGLALLGISITTSQIPLLCGILGVIGSFFKTIVTQRHNN